MTDLKLTVEEPSGGVIDLVTTWIPRLGVSALFLGVGSRKFAAHGMWVQIFARIGIGQWFRYLTGALQVGGALLLVVPRAFAQNAALAGAGILACTMPGAVVAQLFVLRTGIEAIVPAILFVVVALVGARAQGWI